MIRMPRACAWMAMMFLPGFLLAADEDETPTHFGLQATASTPRQDFKGITSRTGLGGGIFFEQDLGDGWSVRARFDYLAFKEQPGRSQDYLQSFAAPDALKIAADQASIGAEVRMHVKSMNHFFILGALSGTRLEFDTLTANTPAGTQPAIIEEKQKTSFKLGLAGGAGWQFTPNFAVTVRYTTTSVNGATLATLEGGLDYRF